MAMPRRASALRTPRLICEALEDRLQPDASLIASLAASNYVPDHILVQFKPNVTPNLILGTTITSSLSLVSGLYDIQLPQGVTVGQALDAYSIDPQVASAQPDYILKAEALPNDPLLNQQWALNSTSNPTATINALAAWNTTTGSGRTIVAVIDTGIDLSHPDLKANLWTNTAEIPGNGIDDDHDGYVDDVNGYNFVSNNGNVNDDNGHGTHVAGIIGAVGNNGIGITGVNWNVKIMALKFLDYSGRGSTSAALRALNYAVQMGATISNNSWTSPAYDSALEAGIRNAGLAGHIYVTAAGNLGQKLDTNKLYPASYALDNVVTVAALDSNNRLASWSNYGQTVDIAAPGVNIYSTLPGGRYGTMSGTSMATPFVTGAMALVRDLHPDWTAQQVIHQVLSTADPLPSLTGVINGGRLDLGAAIGNNPTPPQPPPPPPKDTTGATVVALANLISNNQINGLRVTFSEAIQPGSFDVSDVLNLSGPGGSLAVSSIRQVAGSTTQFDILFASQTRTGTYSLTLGTGILDLAGNALNQNGNSINGETPDDRYSGSVNFTATNTYQATGLPAPVVDYNTSTFTLNVPDSMVIGTVRVQINVSHGWMSDMIIKLRSPTGTEVLLANRRGNGGKGYNNTIFDDAATRPLSQGGGLFPGSYRPETPLSALKGSATNGTWSLVIQDKARGDAGVVLGWSVTFDAAAGPSSVSSVIPGSSSIGADVIGSLGTKVVNPVQRLQPQSLAKVVENAIATLKADGSIKSEPILVKNTLQQQKTQLLKAWQEELRLPASVLHGSHVGLTP